MHADMRICLGEFESLTCKPAYHLKFNMTGPFQVLKNIMPTVDYVVLSGRYKTFMMIKFTDSFTNTHFSPATPCTMRLSLVSVPVLSKQHTSTLPANGILKGSVQYTPRENTKKS